MVREAGDLVSKPVVDMSEGRKLGKVKDAIFDPEKQALFGLLVETDAGEMFLNRTSLRGFGSDAVTVDTHGSVRPIATEPHARALMESGIRLRGTKMITESGDSLGTLDKILLEDDGRVACYQSLTGLLGMREKHEVLPSHVIKIGTDAIIVSDVAADEPGGEVDAARVSRTSSTSTASRAAVNDLVQTDVGVIGATGLREPPPLRQRHPPKRRLTFTKDSIRKARSRRAMRLTRSRQMTGTRRWRGAIQAVCRLDSAPRATAHRQGQTHRTRRWCRCPTRSRGT